MSFSKKVYSLFSVLFFLFILCAGVGYFSMSHIYDNSEVVYNQDLDVLEKVLQADRDLHQALVAERSFFLTEDKTKRDLFFKSHQENIQQAMDRGANVATRLGNSDEINEQYALYQKNLLVWKESSEKLIENIPPMDSEAFNDYRENKYNEVDAKFETARKPIDTITEILVQSARSSVESSANYFSRAKMLLGFVVGLSTILLLLSLYMLNSQVIKKLLAANFALQSASGDIGEHTSSLDATSTELAASANEQNASSHESVSAMEEMRSMVDQTQNYVGSSLNNIDEANTKVEEGKSTLQELLSSMEEIQASSEKIKDVEKVIEQVAEKTTIINDIVFKTQLLSFNASIEAARAGQHGKGFAVVAEEVSQLANVSGGAAKEIGDLLAKSKNQVADLVTNTSQVTERGRSVTDRVENLFSHIAGIVGNLDEEIKGVSSASKEQSEGIKQTLEAMNQLNTTTQQTNVISNTLEQKSNQLQQMQSDLNSVIKNISMILEGKSENTKSAKGAINRSALSRVDLKGKGVKVDLDEDFDAEDDSFSKTA